MSISKILIMGGIAASFAITGCKKKEEAPAEKAPAAEVAAPVAKAAAPVASEKDRYVMASVGIACMSKTEMDAAAKGPKIMDLQKKHGFSAESYAQAAASHGAAVAMDIATKMKEACP